MGIKLALLLFDYEITTDTDVIKGLGSPHNRLVLTCLMRTHVVTWYNPQNIPSD